MGEVNLEHLVKRYGDVTAVDDVDIDIQDGEFVTLVGPSGCGKSTTLEMIAGLTKPTEGTVRIADRDVTNLPPKERGIAMVFQNIALFPHMNVRENVSFGLRIRNVDSEEIDRRVERAAEIVQIEGMLHRMPDELSGGQRQRVAIARSIVREPEVFLMDEPLANLDAALRVHMRTELQRLHGELETTIVYVTHDQEEAMTMSNRLAVMNDGKVQQYAPPMDCYNAPANRFVAGFIGSPSMNFLDGEVVSDGLTTPYFDLQTDVDRVDLEPGRKVTVGIRPEDTALPETRSGLDAPSDPFSATVDVIEPVGDEIFLYVLLDEGTSSGGRIDVEEFREETEADEQRDFEEEEQNQLLMSVSPKTDRNLVRLRGTEVEVSVDLARAHLFDADTGEAILHGLTPEEARRPTAEREDRAEVGSGDATESI